MIPLSYYIALGSIVFALGLAIVLIKQNLIVVLMGIELMLNSSNIILVGASQYHSNGYDGQMFTLFSIIIAVAESAVILAIILRVVRTYGTSNIAQIKKIKED
ncbi:NADH-quinone oxidoreductase subunit NuoK [Cyclobacteriaceae bacterium]|nr:NADH-quinone oxidoreductase subunit NuoK [Cyclobacteriaceae bacterium]